MFKFISALLLTTIVYYAQAAERCREKMVHLSGTLYSTSIYQGGMYRGDEFMPPQIPLGNFTLYIISWLDEKTVPEVVANFTTDANGNFEVVLPAGKYGFATSTDIEMLAPGQWIPHTINTDNLAESYHCWWELSTNAPLDMTLGSLSGITLIRHESTVCGLCP